MEYFLTLLGFIILISSGNYLVKGSVSVARKLRLSTLLIGVTIVAFGTSAPELLVSVQAALANHPEMALGNVIGSNISNIALVLAITAMILPIPVHRNSILIDWPFMMGAGILFGAFALNSVISIHEGILMFLLLFFFVWLSLRISKRQRPNNNNSTGIYNLPFSVFLIIASLFGLTFGAKLLVTNATVIAQDLGISERAIAISMLAVGTSLPELVTSVVAAVQKETDISVGNIIGSNIFNILSVIGISAMIKPIEVNTVIIYDIGVMLVVSIILLIMMVPAKKGKITRPEGLILFVVYFIYMFYVFR